jgi:serine protease Do
MCVVAGVLLVIAAWVGVAHFTSVEAAPLSVNATAEPAVKPVADEKDAKDAKAVDLTALRDAVDTAAKRGENVEAIRKALDAFAKTSPKAANGAVPAELQALRDAVDAAARKGENVEAIAKELAAVERAVAGKSLAKSRPEPRPEPEPNPNPGRVPFPNPFPNPGVFPAQPPAGIDVELFNKAMDLQRKAMELMLKNPNDPEAIKEGQKLRREAAELLLKAAAGGGGGLGGLGGLPAPLFPNDFGRVPERARFGIRMDRVPAVAVEQLGLEPNMGIVVAMVLPNTPAEKAGLKVHDIILEFAGKAVTDNTDDFIRRVNEVKVGQKIDIVVLRKGKKVDVKGVELPDMKQGRVLDQPAKPLPRPVVPNFPDNLGGLPLPLLP